MVSRQNQVYRMADDTAYVQKFVHRLSELNYLEGQLRVKAYVFGTNIACIFLQKRT